MPGIILLMDNRGEILNKWGKLLANEGYKVISANTLEEAEDILINRWIHLAILDIRMKDENDENDISGLLLAKKSEFRTVPKIILTAHRVFDYALQGYELDAEGHHVAFAFIPKDKGAKVLLESIQKAFEKEVQINWKLKISWSEKVPLSFPHLATLSNPNINHKELMDQTLEIEDLFRKLFINDEHIRLDRLLWQREGCLALVCHVFRANGIPESFMVLVGQRANILRQIDHYKDYAPKRPSDTATILLRDAETLHFAGAIFGLSNADFSHISSFYELYQNTDLKINKTTINTLFKKTLAEWHQEDKIIGNANIFSELRSLHLGQKEGGLTKAKFESKVHAIIKELPAYGVNIKHQNGKFNFQVGWQPYSYPDPLNILFDEFKINQTLVKEKTPGFLSGENILVDEYNHAWVTDFADAGFVPVCWNQVALESIIRFDWVKTNDLQRLLELEKCLVEGSFSRLDINILEPVVKYPARVIQIIRSLAQPFVGENELPYHMGILFQAASRIAKYESGSPYTVKEFARFAHTLIAMAFLSEKINNLIQVSETKLTPLEEVQIDKAQHVVKIKGKRVSLRGQGYDLLCYLYDNANQVCFRADLSKQIFGVPRYDDLSPREKENEVNRMNAAIRRLREKIEEDPDNPRFLLTEEGAGYYLVVSQKEK